MNCKNQLNFSLILNVPPVMQGDVGIGRLPYNKMHTINVLWTGGLDSTFRILELSQLPVVIQPYYIWDQTRGSIKQELRAMKRIAADVRLHPQTKASLLPIKIIHDAEIAKNAAITHAWKILHERYSLGSQYDYLARFAFQHGLKLEVGLESSARSKATTAINSESNIVLNNINTGGEKVSFYQIDESASSPEGILIFQNLILPASLWHMSKLDEVEAYRAWGYGDTITKTWFCHRPVFGLPCGHCNPCKDCLNEGLAFRVPRLGYYLGTCRMYLFGILRRIKRVVFFYKYLPHEQ